MTKIKVSEPTIQDEFKKSILQNSKPLAELVDGTPDRQAEIILSRLRLSLLQGFPVSSKADENGKVAFELAKGHLDNAYIAKLPLSLITTAFAVLAKDAQISEDDIQGVSIVKQPGIFRDKVIALLPNAEFAQKITSSQKQTDDQAHPALQMS